MEWMVLPLKRYVEFNGRSRRMEYWMWILFTVIVGFVLGILDTLLGLDLNALRLVPGATGNGLLGILFSLGTFLPSLAVSVRRLHDIDRSGWWVLLPIMPVVLVFVAVFAGDVLGSASVMIFAGVALLGVLICGLLLLVWYCTEGTPGPNRFGDDPKADIPTDLVRTFE